MSENNITAGHRDRLRKKFLLDPQYLSSVEKIELLLTYAIPRVDVKPIAQELINRFEDLKGIVRQPIDELETIPGIGTSAAIFISFIGTLLTDLEDQTEEMNEKQQPLFELPGEESLKPDHKISVFSHDELKTSLALLPKAYENPSKEAFNSLLVKNLPYNTETTRIRRARYILNRYQNYPDIKNPVSLIFSKSSDQKTHQTILFYLVQKQESVASLFAQEIIWPNLALGYITRFQINEFLKKHFPDAKENTILKIHKALLNSYTLLDVGILEGEKLHFSLRNGNLESFLFVLTSEFPEPELIPFDKLFNGFMHHNMLWHRDWMQNQLYRLRELKIISKISEIDFVKQFTLDMDQQTALTTFYNAQENE